MRLSAGVLRSCGAPLCLGWLILACLGLYAAGTLSLGHWLNLPVPCGGSRGCATVAQHPSSRLWGIPIAYIGFTAYGLTLWLISQGNHSWARRAALVITAWGAVISGLLLYYSVTVIQSTCAWCVGSGVIMSLLLLTGLGVWWFGEQLSYPSGTVVFTAALLSSIALGLQAGRMQVASLRPPIAATVLKDVTADQLVDPDKCLGPDAAPVTIVIFGDMWCPGCRAMHGPLLEFQRRHADRVRLAFRHLPLYGLRGHEFSPTAAAISQIAAEQNRFWDYLHEVYSDERSMGLLEFMSKLKKLNMDPEAVHARLKAPSEPAFQKVLDDMALAEQLGVQQTPTFIILAGNHSPISANQRTLPAVIASNLVQPYLQ